MSAAAPLRPRRVARVLAPTVLLLALETGAGAAPAGDETAAGGATAVAPAEAPPLALFVFPVQAGSGLSRGERRLLDARVSVALGKSRRVRALGPRDLMPRARGLLRAGPGDDLVPCGTPECLRAIGAATGAARALGLELLDDGADGVVFATLFDTRTGGILARRELAPPAAAPATRQWADEVARWVVTATVAPAQDRTPDQAGAPPAAPRREALEPVEPVLVIDAGPNPTPEARALAAAIGGLLAARGQPRLAPPGTLPPVVTHRARITVDRVGVSQRQHHLHHDRTAVLAATFTITDARTGAVVFSDGASSQLTARARDAPETALTGALADDVALRWMYALEAQSIERILTPIGKKGQP